MMRNKIRQLARRSMPDAIRKPLGSAAGKFDQWVVQPLQGLLFDLSGGQFKTDGCTFFIPKDQTSMAYRSCFLSGDYEVEERDLVREFVRPADSVLEFGGCLGIVSCATNKILADKTKHVVVEGNPFCIPSLHRNRRLNQSGFLIENCAVSTLREVTFYLHPIYIVGGTTQRETGLPVSVPARSWKELDTRYGPFTTLIIDIEGAELETFESAPELLLRYRLIIVELHDWAIGNEGVERCRTLLAGAGFEFKRRSNITEAWQRK